MFLYLVGSVLITQFMEVLLLNTWLSRCTVPMFLFLRFCSSNYFTYHKSKPSSVPWGIVDLYSALPWVTWEAVKFVEGIP